MSSVLRSELPEPPAAAAPAVVDVVHETVYRYARPVELAQHMAFLRPRDDATQRVRAFELDIEPRPAQRSDTLDAFGNTRTLFALTAPHDALRVTARSRVQALPPPAPAAAPAWEDARARWRYVSGVAPEPAVPFVFASPLLPLHAALRAWAEPSFTPGRPLDEAALELMHRLHAGFRYDPDATHVGTPVLEAFERRAGVCQDFAHVMIAALRALGLAARYVSGYLLTEPPPGQPRLRGADASHAWVAVALPQPEGPGAWLELDPTNDCVAGPGHVRLATGRDYGDVTPLRGVIRGGSRHELAVSVDSQPAG